MALIAAAESAALLYSQAAMRLHITMAIKTLEVRPRAEQTHIGSYTLPSSTAGIRSSQVGFVEYYPWNSDPSLSCDDLPCTVATFGILTTYSSNGGAATLSGGDDNCQSLTTIRNVSGEIEFAIRED